MLVICCCASIRVFCDFAETWDDAVVSWKAGIFAISLEQGRWLRSRSSFSSLEVRGSAPSVQTSRGSFRCHYFCQWDSSNSRHAESVCTALSRSSASCLISERKHWLNRIHAPRSNSEPPRGSITIPNLLSMNEFSLKLRRCSR